MKRIFLSIAIIASFLLIACGTPAQPVVETPPNPVPTPELAQEPIPEPVELVPELVVEEPEIIKADFRNVNWGMSRAEVKDRETEGKFLADQAHVSAFGDLSLAGLDVSLGYLFNVKDQLFAANYLIQEKHSNNTAYITDYENLKGNLIDKYGAPDKDEIIWLDDLWRDDPSDWGMAIVTGDLKYYSRWGLDSLSILLVLEGDNYEVNFKLMYQNNDISDDIGKTGAEGL